MRMSVVLVVLALALAPVSANAEAKTEKVKTETDLAGFVIFNSGGENVAVDSGYLKYTSQTVSFGDNIQVVIHVTMHGKGTGTVTGQQYVLSDVQSYTFSGQKTGFVYTGTGSYRLAQQGRCGDLFLKYTFHATILPDGAVLVSFYKDNSQSQLAIQINCPAIVVD